MRITIKTTMIIFLIISIHSFAANKLAIHLVTIPFIEGTGAFSSINALIYGEESLVKGTSIATLSLLTANVTLGLISLINKGENNYKIRTAHRIVGYSVLASSILLSVARSIDVGTKNAWGNYISYGYSFACIVPIITWRI